MKKMIFVFLLTFNTILLSVDLLTEICENEYIECLNKYSSTDCKNDCFETKQSCLD